MSPKPITKNTLFYGDNLPILREYMADESLEKPSREMVTEAVSAGFYTTPFTGQRYPKIQIVTIEDLLANRRPELPASYGTFKEARRIETETGDRQGKLF